jgi:molybdopterin converting factor small subunit
MPTVEIPGPYTGPTHGAEKLVVPGRTVRECVAAIEASYPGFAPLIFDGGRKVHRFVRLFVNGEPATPESNVAESDVVTILAAIGGGSV